MSAFSIRIERGSSRKRARPTDRSRRTVSLDCVFDMFIIEVVIQGRCLKHMNVRSTLHLGQ